MEKFLEDLQCSAASIDELLSETFCVLPGEKKDADKAARRLAAWCRHSASGDWGLFSRRLAKDGLTIDDIVQRFATVRRSSLAPIPLWVADAGWIYAALRLTHEDDLVFRLTATDEPRAFESLLYTTVNAAEKKLRLQVSAISISQLTVGALNQLCQALLAVGSALRVRG